MRKSGLYAGPRRRQPAIAPIGTGLTPSCALHYRVLVCVPRKLDMNCRAWLCWTVATLALAALPAAAALYKWTDENGRIVYGDTPPAGVKAERVNAAVPPADPNAVREMAAKDAQINKRQQARAEDEAKAEKAQADAKAKLERCAQIRGNIQTLRSDANVFRYNEKGEKVYMEAPDRAKGVADSEKLLRDLNCPAG
jgi:hypothetical protein